MKKEYAFQLPNCLSVTNPTTSFLSESVQDATADVMDENDLARPFIEQCLIEDPAAVTPIPDIESAVRKFIGGIVMSGDRAFDRIMDGVRAKWDYGRPRVDGIKVRGLVGVRIRQPSS